MLAKVIQVISIDLGPSPSVTSMKKWLVIVLAMLEIIIRIRNGLDWVLIINTIVKCRRLSPNYQGNASLLSNIA